MLFGIILATIVSNLVAHHVHPNGLYESELEVDSKGGTCYYLRQEPPHALRSQAAEAVMASPVVGLAPLERVSTVLSVLSGTSHNGFPVLVAAKQHHLQHQHQHQHQHQRQQHDGSTASAGRSSGMLQGLVLRSQLLVLLRHGAFCDERGRYISVPVQQSVAGFEEALGCEMEAASQASASGYRSSSSGSGPEESHGMLGELGPAPSMGIGGGGFPSLDRSRGRAAMPEADVLQAAAAAVEREVEAGRQAYLNLTPFMHLAPITGALPHLGWCRCGMRPSDCGAPVVEPVPSLERMLHMCCFLQCVPTHPPTACTTCSWPCRCATCVWWTGTAAAWASSLARTWIMRRAAAGGGAWLGWPSWLAG
jgi:chloride channel 7